MHALNSITNAMGRCGKASKIYSDMRFSYSQLIQQGLENLPKSQCVDKPATKFKRCARSEPTLNLDTKHRIQRIRHGSRRKDVQDNEETPMNHYTINIYLNGSPNEQILYANSKSSHSDFSVDKLTRNIANCSPIIEGFLKNVDPDKDRDVIEKRLGTLWRDVFEKSKVEMNAKLCEETPLERTTNEKLQVKPKKSELNLKEPSRVKTENYDVKKESYFLHEDKNEQIYVNKDFKLEKKEKIHGDVFDLNENLPPSIPFYEKGFYDSRTVKPRRITSSRDQVRRRLSQDTVEVNKNIENLVRLSTQSTAKESHLGKVITYCKNLLFKGKDEEPKENVSKGFCEIKRRYHCGLLTKGGNSFGRRYFSSRKIGPETREEKLKGIYRYGEKSRLCPSGVTADKRGSAHSKNVQEKKSSNKEVNFAKNASKFTLFNLVLNVTSATDKAKDQSIPKRKKRPKLSQSKSETTLRPRRVSLEPKKIKSEENFNKRIPKPFSETNVDKQSDTAKQILTKQKDKSKLEVLNNTEKCQPQKTFKSKIPLRINQSELTSTCFRSKPPHAYSTTFRKVPDKKPQMKMPDIRLEGSNIFKTPKELTVSNFFPQLKDDNSAMKAARDIINKRGTRVHRGRPSRINEEGTPRKLSRHAIFRLQSKPFLAKTRRQIGVVRRTMSTVNDYQCPPKKKKPPEQVKCQKTKKHPKKDSGVIPTHKKLAKRNSKCSKEPLQYEGLHPRCDESRRPARPKRDIAKEIEGLFDCTKQEQFNCYFGETDYKNREYYSYTKNSFYDLNTYMSQERNAQPSSGAKPK